MSFDLRVAKEKGWRGQTKSNTTKEWDLRLYKVRKSKFNKVVRSQIKGKIDERVLDIFGEEIVKAVRLQAKRAAGMSPSIPRTNKFIESFGYEIVGGDSIKLTSTWPWVKHYLKRRAPYRMGWLSRERGAKKVIALRDKNGEVIFRNAPLKMNNSWVHPAITKYDFIEEGMRRGVDNALIRATQYMLMRGKEK
jgi:hypothetical protein